MNRQFKERYAVIITPTQSKIVKCACGEQADWWITAAHATEVIKARSMMRVYVRDNLPPDKADSGRIGVCDDHLIAELVGIYN